MTDFSSFFTLLDGATGTELGRRGVDISLPLWSARAILEAPDVLAAVHRDYLQAGADAITANTFRTHRRSLAQAGMAERAGELTRRAVEIARSIRDATKPGALVLGSVAPLEDCYRPDLAPDEAACRREHAEMIAHLVEAGVDAILIETMNSVREAAAAAEEARRVAPGRWYLSVCTQSGVSRRQPATLLSGEPFESLLPALEGTTAVGVNCVAAPDIEADLRVMRALLPADVHLMAYANIGYATPTGDWECTDAVQPETYAGYGARWIDAGATIIGGCCGTTPETIRALNRLRM